MKRSVFLLVFVLLGFKSPGLSPGYTYLTSITPCDALCVNQKEISTIKPSFPDRFKLKDQYALSPLKSNGQELPIASIKTSAILLTEAQTARLSSRSLSHSRRKSKKHKPTLLNRFNNAKKAPP